MRIPVVAFLVAALYFGCGDEDDSPGGPSADGGPDGGDDDGDAGEGSDGGACAGGCGAGAVCVEAACACAAGHEGDPDVECFPFVPAGDRVLAFEINQPAGLDHLAQVAVARDIGVGGIQLTMPWAYLEPNAGARDTSFLELGMGIYADQGLAVLLSVPTVDTVALLVPEDLRASVEAGDLSLDAPEVTGRFAELLDAVLAVTGDELAYLVIANEVDIHLSSRDAGYQDAFAAFFAAGVAHVHAARPGLPVGLSLTHRAILDDDADLRAIAGQGDVLFVTYYQTGNLGGDPTEPFAYSLDRFVAYADGKPVVMKELGYATGPALGGSPEGQAAFWTEVFLAWDEQVEAVPYLMVSRMFDGVRAECEATAMAYGLGGNEAFIQFLCTLGIRTVDDLPKPAWDRVASAATARGF